MAELVEVSGEVQMEDLQPLLEYVASLIPSGFGDAEVSQVVALARGMDVDDEEAVGFAIRYGGEETSLGLQVFMDDIDLPGLYFFVPSGLAALIGEQIEAYGRAQEPPEGE